MTRSRATRTARGSARSAALGSRSHRRALRSPLARSRRAGAVTAAATDDSDSPRCAPACLEERRRVQIRCLIVDDNQPFLDAARMLLEREGVAVVGIATTSAEALRLEQEL